MSGSVVADSDARSNALAAVARIKSRITEAQTRVRSGALHPDDLLKDPSSSELNGVSVLKVLECVPALGKTGARSVTSAAGIQYFVSFDELTADQVSRLRKAIMEFETA